MTSFQKNNADAEKVPACFFTGAKRRDQRLHRRRVNAAVEHQPFFERGAGRGRRQRFHNLFHIAAARRGEADDRFTRKIVAFEKAVRNQRRCVVPDGEREEDHVVVGHRRGLVGEGGLFAGEPFAVAAGKGIGPFEVGVGVGRRGRNGVIVGVGRRGKQFCFFGGRAAGGKAGNKNA